MTKEQLLELGLSEEMAEKVSKASSDELKGYIPKHRFDEVNNELKTTRDGLKDRDSQLEKLKKVDVEKYEEEIAKLQEENKRKDEEHAKIRHDDRVSHAIELHLNGKVHDVSIVSALIDKSKIEFNEDGSIKSGLEQIESLKKEKAFLFVPEKEEKVVKPEGINPAESSKEPQVTPEPKTLLEAITNHYSK